VQQPLGAEYGSNYMHANYQPTSPYGQTGQAMYTQREYQSGTRSKADGQESPEAPGPSMNMLTFVCTDNGGQASH
jgi:hypothetical protein